MCFNGIETNLVICGQLISKRFLTQLVVSLCTQIIACVINNILMKKSICTRTRNERVKLPMSLNYAKMPYRTILRLTWLLKNT